MKGSFKDLKVYQMAYELAMEIFNISKNFSKEETYFFPVKYCGYIFPRILP
ncbi:MAG: four helix bundle protein [Candidatus Marinimicrobia bacterium]|nr:four helix bundle protein [Candidatus Neomarinimicrobiota bacterium]